MVSFPEFGPLFLAGAAAISLYLVYRLSKISRQLEILGQNESGIHRKSSAAQVLCELEKANPDFSPLLAMMCDDVKGAGGERIQACRMFLYECENFGLQRVRDASGFRQLYYGYLDAIKQTEGSKVRR